MKFKAKNAHNPFGYGRFLTKKFVKKTVFRTILPYQVVANPAPFLIDTNFDLHVLKKRYLYIII